ncbi:MAG: 2,3,4,5-tetrahydropyridine-2,6-dicarboxylate N-succinyltransferase [Oligoflexia bacterium]|nr:2,3,4,5-tetrahydropyridine-2,6-dicarboxylate N-succinyltransferase [Oligoflexia bacterium]
MKDLSKIISQAYDGNIDFKKAIVVKAVESVIRDLDKGKLRVCTQEGKSWVTHQWLKQAILLYFRQRKMSVIKAGALQFFDKVPLKKWTGKEGVRVVPHALVRYGAHVASGAILMPSYVNIGAFVGGGSMVDTWATVGSCAQIGENVHLSGGVGIGGVLEPIQANPVIIENNAFIGSRCIVVEGVHVQEGAVLGAGCVITASTKILDVTGSQVKEYKGLVPKNSVVIPGTIPKMFPAGEYGVPCALIIGQRSEKTNSKTSLTEALREFNVPV